MRSPSPAMRNFTPKFAHDCPKCKFMFHVLDRNALHVDVYESCQTPPTGSKYIVRYSSEGSDYVTADDLTKYIFNVTLKQVTEKGKVLRTLHMFDTIDRFVYSPGYMEECINNPEWLSHFEAEDIATQFVFIKLLMKGKCYSIVSTKFFAKWGVRTGELLK